jgi:hypothetical protein
VCVIGSNLQNPRCALPAFNVKPNDPAAVDEDAILAGMLALNLERAGTV